MRPINQEQHDHARNLFFQSGKTRAQIAEAVGVSEKTIYLWTRAGDWKRLRSAGKLMPSLIVENFYSQIQELNDDIRNREPGKRYPSTQEAEVFRKLTLTAERIKKGHTQGEYAEMMQKFMDWIGPQSHEHLQLFTTYADRFLKARSPEGFAPYDLEYSAPEPPLPRKEETMKTPSLPGEGVPPFCGTGGASLVQDTPTDDTNISSPSERPGEVETPPLFLGEVPEGGRGPLAQDTPADDNNTSLSLGEGRGEAPLAQDTPTDNPNTSSPSERPGEVEQEIISQRPETTGNNSEISYEATTNTSGENPEPKQEITKEQEITQTDNLSLSLGDPDNYRESEAPLAKDDPGVEIGYLGIKQKPEPGGGMMLEIQQNDPDIQRFSIGEAIYYTRKKQ